MSVPPPAPAPSSFWESPFATIAGVLVLVAALIAAYSNSFTVPFMLDDADSITSNPSIRSFATAWFPPSGSGITTSGRPLLNLSLAINYAIHGSDAFGYHAGNLLIHTLGALTLWGVIRRTLRQPLLARRFSTHATPLAWCAAALWALHPLQTESVTYVIQRAESLVGLFYLLTLYCFIRATEKPGASSRPWFLVTVFACLAGMASKEVMASAPLLVFLYDRTFVSGSFADSWKRHRKLHLSLAATWIMLLACIIQSGGRGSTVGYTHVAWWEYAITQGPAIVGYLWRSVWPANLIFDYGAIVEKNPAVVIPACAAILVLLGLAIHALRNRPVAGFAFAWFFLILAPTSSIVPVATQTVAEHRMYLPLAAVVVPAAILLYLWSQRYAWMVLSVLLVAAGLRTHDRNHDYRSELAIWEDTVARVPDSVRALNNLGSILFREGRAEEATVQFHAAIELIPEYADAHHNLGCALINLQRPAEAVIAIEHALSLSPQNPQFLASLGNAYIETSQPEKALAAYQQAVALKPAQATHSFNIANTLMKLDRMEEAGRMYLTALELAPNDVEIVNNYATWLRRSNRPTDAVPVLEKALRLSPGSARVHSNLGICLIQSGRPADGIRQLEIALPLDPDLPQTRYNLGTAYAENGRPADAIPHFEALLKLSAPTAELLDNLGVLYAQTQRYSEAIATFRRALELDPTHRNARENLAQIEGFLRQQNAR